ncbi:MAG: hypothetical protein DRI61_11650, partial [Chloroflexi bacterium]
ISPQDTEFTASYVIFTDGSTYYAQNGTSGLIDFSGTNASWVINQAIQNMPDSGGKITLKDLDVTVKEEITLKSNVTIEGINTVIKKCNEISTTLVSTALAGNNTIDVIDATGFTIGDEIYIKKTDNIWNSEFAYIVGISGNTITLDRTLSYDHSAGELVINDFPIIHVPNNAHNVLIRGLILDGNRAGRSNATDGRCALIFADKNGVSDVYVENCITQNHLNTGIVSAVDENMQILSCVIDNCGGNGGIDCGDATTNVRIENCEIKNCEQAGIYFCLESDNIVVAFNNIHDNYDGIKIGKGHENMKITYNSIYDNTNAGILFTTASGYYNENISISGNKIRNNKYGIYMNEYNKNIKIIGNDITGSSSYGIMKACTYYTLILGNYFEGNTNDLRLGLTTYQTRNTYVYNNIFTGTVSLINTTDYVFKDNIGYVTEATGSYEITGDGTNTSFTISHGLATTPSQVLITPTNSSMASATYWVSAKDATTFTITFSSAPASGTKLSFDWYAKV